ncbi:unnamed protein product [Calypogeia fissa]
MMAHNLSAHHTLSSAFNHRASPYLGQDQMISSRHIPILSVPDILDAFHQTHASSTANMCNNNSRLRSTSTHVDPWELPELKWLDPAENSNMVDRSSDHISAEPDRFNAVHQSLTSLVPEKFSFDSGERWPFSELYGGDQAAAANNCAGAVVDDSCLTQFSLQSMVTASASASASPAASSGSSILTRKIRGMSGSTTNISNFASSRDFPKSAAAAGCTPLDWRNDLKSTTVTPTCSSGSHKRSVPSDRPDSDLTQEISNSGPSTDFKVGAAENFLPGDRLRSSKRESPSSTISFPAGKRKRPLQDGGAIPCSPAGPSSVQKPSVEKGSGSKSAIKEQSVSPNPEVINKKAAGAAASTAAAAASDHEIHIWTERERRKKMNGMFTTLHSLLPHLASKADKSTIVDEAINYIQSLEVTMKGMLKRKCERSKSSGSALQQLPSSLVLLQPASKHHGGDSSMVTVETGDKISPADISMCGSNGKVSVGSTGDSHKFQTLCSPNIVLNICGSDAFITICSPRGRSGLLCRVLFVMESHRLQVLNAHISTTDDMYLFMLHAQSLDKNQFSNPDMLNITLQDLTNCLGTTTQ